MSEEQKKEKLSELRKKEQEIRDILTKKTKELKKICMREAVRSGTEASATAQFAVRFVSLPSLCEQELTGKLPKEYPLSSGERPPQIRRRVGTSFKLDDLFPYNEVCIHWVDLNPVAPSLVFRLSSLNVFLPPPPVSLKYPVNTMFSYILCYKPP